MASGEEEHITLCRGESYTWDVNGRTYEVAGQYNSGAAGDCAEDHVLNLDFYTPTADIMMEDEICAGEEVFVAGQIFTTTGIHTVELEDGNGCSYKVILDLVVSACNQSSIGSRVWEDLNADGIRDAAEPPIEGVIVELYTVEGILVGTTTTDMNGNYFFGDIEVGDYYLEFKLPDDYSGFIPTIPMAGSDKTKDSNLLGDWSIYETSILSDLSWSTDIVTVSDNTAVMDIDAGFYEGNRLGDQVWIDHGEFGVFDGFDDSDTPLEGVTVNLYNGQDSLISSLQTDEFGKYNFSHLPAGDYYVEFIAPDGYAFVQPDATDDESDSDAYVDLFDNSKGISQKLTLFVGEVDATIDAGLIPNSILGLELLDFAVRYEESDNIALLDWSTINEVNTDIFEIEKSHEATEEFTKIDEVQAAGNSAAQQNYNFVDEDLESGTYYYRLKMIDLDDTYTYSPVRSIQVKERYIKSSISSIYPNPTTGRVNIEIQKSEMEAVITGGIYDVLGEELIVITHDDNVRNAKLLVDLSSLAEGDYIVRIQIGTEVFVKKIVLTKAD